MTSPIELKIGFTFPSHHIALRKKLNGKVIERVEKGAMCMVLAATTYEEWLKFNLEEGFPIEQLVPDKFFYRISMD